MEDKQLNFNQPLLSVRRSSPVVDSKNYGTGTHKIHSSKPFLPFYKSELKSGPVSNPGTVPFVWEQSPGRPKGKEAPKANTIEQPPSSPSIPPGRTLRHRNQDSEKNSENPNDHNYNTERVQAGSQITGVPFLNENEINFESSWERIEEGSDFGDGDSAYVDALDTLSRTESFFLNCSMSGLSGLDGADVKPSGILSIDQQTRDLMMSRFLPAAKAMASEAPQFSSWRPPEVPQISSRRRPQLGVLEHSRQIKVVNKEKPPQLRYGPNILSHYMQDDMEEFEEEEESDEDFDEHGKLSSKVCGLLPRFCMKNSFFLLNPVSGMNMRNRIGISPVSNRQARSLSAVSPDVTKNEHSRISATRQTPVLHTTMLHKKKSILKNGSARKDAQNLKASSSYKFLQDNSVSHQHNKLPLSPFKKQSFADHDSSVDTASTSPVVEKTLFVDIVHKVEFLKLYATSPVMKEPENLTDLQIHAYYKEGTEENPSLHSFHKETENLHSEGEANLQPDKQKPFESLVLFSASKSNQEVGMDNPKGLTEHEDTYPKSTVLENLRSPDHTNIDHEVQQCQKTGRNENSSDDPSEFSAPPPLPKSPSDSWLFRTLGPISSRYPSSMANNGLGISLRVQDSKTSSDSTWQTDMKTIKEPMKPIQED